MKEIAGALDFVHRLPNPAAFADVSIDRSLKVLIYQARA
jgi:23S rRNA (cytosine1962-C5)-methyltransferase